MFEKILVPVDGSENSMKALEKAISLGEKFNSEIYTLSVLPESSIFNINPQNKDFYKYIEENAKEATKETIKTAKQKLENYQGQYYVECVVGYVADEIIKYADEKNIDLIVMGNRGMGAFSRTILGSVSSKVVNQSHISVLVVKTNK